MSERSNLVIEGPDSPLKERVIQYYQKQLGWDVVPVQESVKDGMDYDDAYRIIHNCILVSTHISVAADSIFWRGKHPFNLSEKKAYDRALQERACIILVMPEEKETLDKEWAFSASQRTEIRRSHLVFWTEMNDVPFHSIQNANVEEWEKIIPGKNKVICEDAQKIKVLT